MIGELATRLKSPLPGASAQRRMQPELSFGRHFSPPPTTARPAAVLVLLCPTQEGWTVPLTLRPDDLADHPGQISLPGGAVEDGESTSETALRELREELGVASSGIELLGPLSKLYLYHSDFLIWPWLAVTRNKPIWRPNPREVAELIELPLAMISPVNQPATLNHEQRGLRFRAPCYRWRRHAIWGATAMILAELGELVAKPATVISIDQRI